jgi:hypothetical protein
MLALAEALLADGARNLHMYLHSPTLCPGMTPFVRTHGDLDRLYETMTDFLERLGRRHRIRFATVSEAADLLQPERTLAPSR